MLLEQAFHALPEILCGSRYPGQDYESGVVMALTMALLQELNGRNVPNPLGCIQGECLYEKTGFSAGAQTPRYLRADLVLDTRALMVASRRLGSHYGWRHSNWLEAKFFRARGKVTDKTKPTALLLADILRLAILVPERPGTPSSTGRYLLHIYDRPPAKYISSSRYKNANGAGGKRQWASVVNDAGTHTAKIADLNKEPSTFQKALGAMGSLTLELSLTNTVLTPNEVPQPDGTVYWCVLTRINTVTCHDGVHNFAIAADRTVSEGKDGDFAALRSIVAMNLGEVPEAETTKPDDPAVAPDAEDQVEDVSMNRGKANDCAPRSGQ